MTGAMSAWWVAFVAAVWGVLGWCCSLYLALRLRERGEAHSQLLSLYDREWSRNRGHQPRKESVTVEISPATETTARAIQDSMRRLERREGR